MESHPAPAVLPDWAVELSALYESGAASQFLLHGNTGDDLVGVFPDGPRLVGLADFLRDILLQRFDVILGYDLGNGLRVEKGGEIFAKWPSLAGRELPLAPREAVACLTHYLRFCAHHARLQPGSATKVAVILRSVDLVAPAGSAQADINAMALQLREWSSDPAITSHHCATFLIVENLGDLHRLLAQNPRAARISLPLPDSTAIRRAMECLRPATPRALPDWQPEALERTAAALTGATLHATRALLQRRHHAGQALGSADLTALKKELVEQDAQGLIDFLPATRTLDDLHGLEGVKQWLRQDISLWRQNDLAALPMGYLFCGPVGTGKTYMVECLAGEAGVPVVRLKNFRDRWVGSTESNLEKIFRLLHALGRCIVFIDEADQALGRRSAESGDSGISGRIYGMMAEQMSRGANRGRLLWALATSRPDLVEVDLKRPGRIDVKIPLFPTSCPEEGYALIRSLARRRGLELPPDLPPALTPRIPDLLTPGAAEAVAVKTYRATRTQTLDPLAALDLALIDYQPPVALEILENQIRLAVAETTDLGFVPHRFRP